MSISIEWSAQGDKWLLRRGGEGALCRIGGHCSHHAHRTQYIHKHTTLTYFHNFSFLYFSYIFIFFQTFPYHGGHCSHHMHCTQYIHKHTTITFLPMFWQAQDPRKVLHNPEAVPKCGYFAPQWNVNNSSFMFLCFLGYEDTRECTAPKVTKYIEVRDVQKLLHLTYVEQWRRGAKEKMYSLKSDQKYHPPQLPPPPKYCFSGCPYEPWPAKSFRCWRKNVDECQEAFHSQRTIGAKLVKSSAQLL